MNKFIIVIITSVFFSPLFASAACDIQALLKERPHLRAQLGQYADKIKSMPGDTTCDQLLGGAKEDWLPFLKSRAKSGVNVEQLNPEFAKNLMGMLKEAEGMTGQRATINSGYRSIEHQKRLYAQLKPKGGIVAPPGRSKHNFGLAVDVGPLGRFNDTLQKISTKYNIINPPAIRAGDAWHFQAVKCEGACQNHNPAEGGSGDMPKSEEEYTFEYKQPAAQQGQGAQQTNPSFQREDEKKPTVEQTPGEFTCEPQSVTRGAPVTLFWKCPLGSTSAIGSGGIGQYVYTTGGVTEGGAQVKPLQSVNYSLSCTNAKEEITKFTCNVDVKEGVTLKGELQTSASVVRKGRSATVTWSATGTKCYLERDGEVVKESVRGSYMATNLTTSPTLFTLSCMNTSDEREMVAERSVTVQ